MHMVQMMPLQLTVSCSSKSTFSCIFCLLCQVPPITDYNVSDGQTYKYLHDDPLYPFGYGLSYSQFRYNDIIVHPSVIVAGHDVFVDVCVTNVGPYEADEVRDSGRQLHVNTA